MLDDGVVEGERGGGGGEGRREEERSVEGDAMRREGVRETRPLLWVEVFKIHLLPFLPVLLFLLLSPHPLLLPLLSLLLYPFPLHLPLLLLLSLLLNNSSPHSRLVMYAHERSSFRCISAAVFINNITISDMIAVKIITPTTVDIITAVSSLLINDPAGFVINC